MIRYIIELKQNLLDISFKDRNSHIVITYHNGEKVIMDIMNLIGYNSSICPHDVKHATGLRL